MRDSLILFVGVALALPIVQAAPYLMLYSDAQCRDPEFALQWNSTCSEIKDNVDVCSPFGNHSYSSFFCASSDAEIQARFAKGKKLVKSGIYKALSACTESEAGTRVNIADGACHVYQLNASYIDQIERNGSWHSRSYAGTKCRGRVQKETWFPVDAEEVCIPTGELDFQWYPLAGTGESAKSPANASKTPSLTNATTTKKPETTTPANNTGADNNTITPGAESRTPVTTPVSSNASTLNLYSAIVCLLAVIAALL